MIKAVIIDVDDTLCLTEESSFNLENDVLQQMGREPMTRSIHKATWGRPLFEAIIDRSTGVDVAEFKRVYWPTIEEHVTSGKLDAIPAQNYAAMDKLVEQGKSLMLLTSRTHGELKHMMAPDHLLASKVTAFYYRDNMQYHKPDPRAFQDLLRTSKLRPEECVYVGDSTSDAEASNAAGLLFIASLESGLRQKQDFAPYKVAAFVDTFPDIVEAIASLDRG